MIRKTVLVQNVEYLMAEKGLSKMQLSFDARLPMSRIGDILRGKTINPKVDTALKLANALGVTVDVLISKPIEEKTVNQ